MLMQNFGVTKKEHYGMLWYFLEWSIGWRFYSRPVKPEIATQKYKIINSGLFWVDCASDLSSFWKRATPG